MIKGLDLPSLHGSTYGQEEGSDQPAGIYLDVPGEPFQQAAKPREIRVQCCSAKTEEGIWEGLKLLADIFE